MTTMPPIGPTPALPATHAANPSPDVGGGANAEDGTAPMPFARALDAARQQGARRPAGDGTQPDDTAMSAAAGASPGRIAALPADPEPSRPGIAAEPPAEDGSAPAEAPPWLDLSAWFATPPAAGASAKAPAAAEASEAHALHAAARRSGDAGEPATAVARGQPQRQPEQPAVETADAAPAHTRNPPAASITAAAEALATAPRRAPPVEPGVSAPLPATWLAAVPGAAAAVPAPVQAEVVPAPMSREFAPALAAQVSVLVRDGVEHAQLRLNPAELGPIDVRISVDGSSAQIDFSAAQALTRQALQDAVPMLAGALRESGLTLTGGGVFEQPRDPRGEPRSATPGHRGPVVGSGEEPTSAPRMPRTRGVVDLYA